jgi:uncharacterized protein YceK
MKNCLGLILASLLSGCSSLTAFESLQEGAESNQTAKRDTN